MMPWFPKPSERVAAVVSAASVQANPLGPAASCVDARVGQPPVVRISGRPVQASVAGERRAAPVAEMPSASRSAEESAGAVVVDRLLVQMTEPPPAMKFVTLDCRAAEKFVLPGETASYPKRA